MLTLRPPSSPKEKTGRSLDSGRVVALVRTLPAVLARLAGRVGVGDPSLRSSARSMRSGGNWGPGTTVAGLDTIGALFLRSASLADRRHALGTSLGARPSARVLPSHSGVSDRGGPTFALGVGVVAGCGTERPSGPFRQPCWPGHVRLHPVLRNQEERSLAA